MKLSSRQQEIVNASMDLIADYGIQSLTMKNIAQSLGISEPAIYRHFSSKSAIIEAVIDEFAALAADVLDRAENISGGALDRIEMFLFDRYRRCLEHPKAAKLMLSEEIFQSDERLASKVLEMMHRHRERIEAFITSGIASGEIRDDISPTVMFRIIFGPMRLVIKQWCLSGYKFDLEKEGWELWQAVRKMIGSGTESCGNFNDQVGYCQHL